MKNLFIMHTQYNLILSAAVLSKLKDGENTLVLYSEFSVSEDMRASLSRLFDRVLVVRDRFYPLPNPLKEIWQIRKDMKKVKCLRNAHFDNIYMSQERIFDMILCARAKKINPTARCYHIEEDAYYSINEKFNDPAFEYRLTPRQRRRRFLYALLLAGYPYDYKDVHYCYGMSRQYHGAYLQFPALARRELQGKELMEIDASQLATGIQDIYRDQRTHIPTADKYTLFFFDLMNRYKDVEQVKATVTQIINASKAAGRTVLLKYHPRETDKFPAMDGCFEIPHIVPAEKVLYDLMGTDTLVMGNATTSCIVAAKLGFRVISICKTQFPTNEKMHTVMENMGVFCIKDTCNIAEII